MKKIAAIVSALVATATVATASAQSAGETHQVDLPPGYAICRTAALAPNAQPVSNIPACNGVSPALLGRLAQMQQQLATVRGQVNMAQATANEAKEAAVNANQRAAALEDRTHDLEGRVDAVEVRADAQTLDTANHEARIQKLEEHATTTDRRLTNVEGRLADMDSLFPKLTLRGGAAAFTGFGGGDSYAGFPVTLELSLPVSPKYSVSFEGGAALALSDSPFGVVGRLGVEYRLSDKWSVGPGLSAYGVGLDSSLDSSVMFTGLDGRVTYRMSDSLVVGGSVMPLGVDVSGTHDAKYAVGGNAFAGLVF